METYRWDYYRVGHSGEHITAVMEGNSLNNGHYMYVRQLKADGLFDRGEINWKDLAQRLGYKSGEALRSQFKREKNKRGDDLEQAMSADGNGEMGESDNEREQTSYRELDDAIHVICDSRRIRTKQDVIDHFNIDTNMWEVKEFTIRTSEVTRKDKSGEWHVQGKEVSGEVYDSGKMLVIPLVHTETKFVRKIQEDGISLEKIDEFFKNIDLKQAKKFSETRQYKDGGLVLEIDLADVHVGNESLSFDELRNRVVNLISEIKHRSVGLTFEKIYLVQLGDILHFDNFGRQTTSGTHVTYGMNFHTMFESAMELMIWVIEELSSISKVEVINIYGNHDKINSYTLAKAIDAYFRMNKDVVIDATPNIRKFRKIGVSSVAFLHGDMPKSNIYDVFQKEARKLFGETLYSELHLGHLHHEISLEKSGVIVRYVPSITIPDEWHRANGYTGAKQGTHCFLWDLEKGLKNIWIIPANR